MCVVPVATYGAEVWWPGMKRPVVKGTVTPQTTHMCNLIDKAIHWALRAALSIWRTTPNAILNRESGIPPSRVILEGSRLQFAARNNSLDDRHPLRSRSSVCPNMGTLKYKKTARLSKRPETQMSRLQRAYRQFPPSTETPEALSAPVYSENLGTKAEGIVAHEQWARFISSTDICAYSDGSSEGHGRFAWRYVLQRGGETFDKNNGIIVMIMRSNGMNDYLEEYELRFIRITRNSLRLMYEQLKAIKEGYDTTEEMSRVLIHVTKCTLSSSFPNDVILY